MSLKEDFERKGVVLLRGLIDPLSLQIMQAAWAEFAKTPRTVGFNPVAVDGPFPAALNVLYSYPPLLDAVEEVFGHDIALYNFRFVVKDEHARGPVFLHQDTGYHVGWPTKLSAFVSFSHAPQDNAGALRFWLGTHKFGYLGDAGEIHRVLVEGMTWYSPVLRPGDVVLMHSACWHESWPMHDAGPDRILADIIYQPANDPTGIELLRGDWRCEPKPWLRDKLFTRSRSSRLIEMQEKLTKAGIE